MILLWAQKQDALMRYFALTPGYHGQRFNSNEAMVQLPLSLMQGSSQLFDLLMKASSKKSIKVLLGLCYAFPHIWLTAFNQCVYHEWGHARAAAALGGGYYFTDVASKYRANNVFAMYGLGLMHPFDFSFKGAMTHSTHEKPQYQHYRAIAGINNQAHLAQAVANLVFNQNGHLLYFSDYIGAKLAATGYILRNEHKRHVVAHDLAHLNISENEIKLVNSATCLLSATTWAFVYSLLRGELIVQPIVWHGWRLPDFNMYFSTQAAQPATKPTRLSIEMVTGYHINPAWYMGLEVEHVYRQNQIFEMRPEIRYTMGSWRFMLQGVINTEHQMSWNAGVDWTFWKKRFTIKAKYIQHNPYTLVGERNIPFWKSVGSAKNKDHELCIQLCWNYSRENV